MIVYYCVYAASWLIGLLVPAGRVDGTRKTGLVISAISLLGIALFFAVFANMQMGVLIFEALPLFILLPALAIGLGLIFSAMARRLSRGGHPGWAWALGATSVLGPLTAFAVFEADRRAATEVFRADLAVFQAGDVRGRLGGEALRFPASPQLRTIHACADHRRCHTMFWRHGDRLQAALMQPNPDVLFEKIELLPVHETYEGPDAPLNDCTRAADLADWCGRRPDLDRTIWCRNRIPHGLTFVSARQDAQSEVDHRIPQAAGSLGRDANGDEIGVECSATRDRVIENNPGMSRLCRVRLTLPGGPHATIFLDRVEAARMDDEARAMIGHARAFWTALTGR